MCFVVQQAHAEKAGLDKNKRARAWDAPFFPLRDRLRSVELWAVRQLHRARRQLPSAHLRLDRGADPLSRSCTEIVE